MKKFVAVFTVLTLCGVIGGSFAATNANKANLQPVSEHGVVPGSNAISLTAL